MIHLELSIFRLKSWCLLWLHALLSRLIFTIHYHRFRAGPDQHQANLPMRLRTFRASVQTCLQDRSRNERFQHKRCSIRIHCFGGSTNDVLDSFKLSTQYRHLLQGAVWRFTASFCSAQKCFKLRASSHISRFRSSQSLYIHRVPKQPGI